MVVSSRRYLVCTWAVVRVVLVWCGLFYAYGLVNEHILPLGDRAPIGLLAASLLLVSALAVRQCVYFGSDEPLSRTAWSIELLVLCLAALLLVGFRARVESVDRDLRRVLDRAPQCCSKQRRCVRGIAARRHLAWIERRARETTAQHGCDGA